MAASRKVNIFNIVGLVCGILLVIIGVAVNFTGKAIKQ